MTHTPALLGGTPIRTTPYPIHTTIMDDSEENAIVDVIRRGHLSGFSARPGDRFFGGPYVLQLEKEFASYFHVPCAVTFNSATSALHAMVSAGRIGPGDEVIVPPTTMSATATSVLMQNAIPVFADIENETFGLDPQSVSDKISARTKAILTVNLFGHPSRLQELQSIAERENVLLLEDNAQAPGATLNGTLTGTFGDMAAQSLNYHKVIQTGEGGVVIGKSDTYTRHLQLVRNHGEVVIDRLAHTDEDLINMVGWNYRLTEVQAAIGIQQIKKLNSLNTIRQKLAARLTKGLAKYDFIVSPVTRSSCTHVYYLYAMRFLQSKCGIPRETFVKAMQAEGISVSPAYMRPIYLEPMYQNKVAYGSMGCPFSCPFYQNSIDYSKGLCPVAEDLYFNEFVITDICKYPNTEDEIDQFLEAVDKISANLASLRSY